jgi:hypothetical protein
MYVCIIYYIYIHTYRQTYIHTDIYIYIHIYLYNYIYIYSCLGSAIQVSVWCFSGSFSVCVGIYTQAIEQFLLLDTRDIHGYPGYPKWPSPSYTPQMSLVIKHALLEKSQLCYHRCLSQLRYHRQFSEIFHGWWRANGSPPGWIFLRSFGAFFSTLGRMLAVEVTWCCWLILMLAWGLLEGFRRNRLGRCWEIFEVYDFGLPILACACFPHGICKAAQRSQTQEECHSRPVRNKKFWNK